ncbi:hypothetical protein EDB84DRAFT_1600714 [Lactarius hengduanensis]|nr:hypothetical protein EDB84DRAFT_1600714 [Lactarius hengduanensis]
MALENPIGYNPPVTGHDPAHIYPSLLRGPVIQIFTISKGIGSLTPRVPSTLGPLTLGYLSLSFSPSSFSYTQVDSWPSFSFDCPHGTPFTPLVWCLFHFCSFGVFAAVRHIKGLFHGPASGSMNGSTSIGTGFGTACRGPWSSGIEAQQSEIENFATSVPKFFDTYARLGRQSQFLNSEPRPEKSAKRLQMCLKCLLYWAREFNRNSALLPSYFPLPDHMARRLQAEQDPTSTMMGRCFGALIAKKLAADINSCHSSGVRGREAKLPGAIGLANIVSLMASSEMNTFITEKAR